MSKLHLILLPSSLLFSMALAAGGCDSEEIGDPELVGLSEEIVEIVENLELAGYPREEIEIDDQEVVVGGDAVVTLEASREMVGHINEDGVSFRQYATTNRVSDDVQIICIDPTGAMAHPYNYPALAGAANEYNQLGLSFEFVVTSAPNSSCDAIIETTIIAGTSAKAGFPSGGLPYNRIKMGSQIPNYGLNVLRHVWMHEIGHCVGLRHTDYFDRSLSCGEGGDEGVTSHGAEYIQGTHPGYDSASVMAACYSTNESGEFSVFDVIALVQLYAAY